MELAATCKHPKDGNPPPRLEILVFSLIKLKLIKILLHYKDSWLILFPDLTTLKVGKVNEYLKKHNRRAYEIICQIKES